mmetsp:Transcript_18441/g.21216  ORF Transcript_18441/g.21216 Transcript_18441/m.21216 type:complete len:479 (+) Transcript_18441:48-1484(+)
MAPFIGVLSTLFALNGSSSKTKNYHHTPSSSLLHATSTNTNLPTTTVDVDDTILPNLCHLFRASPTDTLSLRTNNDNGLRGIYTDKPVGENDVILRIPLSSCITDAEPPRWLQLQQQGGSSDDDDDSTSTAAAAAANAVSVESWVTRLTANLLEAYKLNNNHVSDEWFQLFPTDLREILPIHWDTDSNTEQFNDNLYDTRLEMAVDSAYFARAEMVSVLVASLTNANLIGGNTAGAVTERDVEHCLDLVQTRSCRVESSDDSGGGAAPAPPLRVLAPIFDMINHSPNPNAEFIREGDTLEVRALRDIPAEDEVFISYGSSTQPAWKCLFSYGFVPVPANDDNEVYETDAAELKVVDTDGTILRFEVSPVDIPLELIRYEATGSAWNKDQTTEQCLANPVEEEMGLLTVDVGNRILERIRVAAAADNGGTLKDGDGGGVTDDGQEVVAASVALLADLRESNRRTLLACASGFQEFLDEM